MLISMPQYSFLAKIDFDDVALKHVLLWVKDEEDKSEKRLLIDKIADKFEKELPDVDVRISYIDEDNN